MAATVSTASAAPAGSSIVAKDNKVLKIATFTLQKYLKENEFADEFLSRGGLRSLCEIIRNSSGNTLAYALKAMNVLMDLDHGWETLDSSFVAQIVNIVVHQTLVNICRPATAILIKLACADKTSPNTNIQCYGFPIIHIAMEIQPSFLPTLVQRLQTQDYMLCLNSLSLINALMRHVTDEHRVEFIDALDVLNVRKSVSRIMNSHPSEELTNHLIEFQSLIVRNAHRRRRTQVSWENTRHKSMLDAIWEAAGVTADEKTLNRRAVKWRKIGFSSEHPLKDFHRCGVYGLENMYSFVQKNRESYTKMIQEQLNRPDERRCPFARASVEVTELLCEYWDISTGYTQSTTFQPLLLSFEQVHHVTLQSFFNYFSEMEATLQDFPKVSALIRSRIKLVLRDEVSRGILEYENEMVGVPYQKIKERRLKELEWGDDLLGREAVKSLRIRLYKQSYSFIKNQRISCLLEGAWFTAQSRSIVSPPTPNYSGALGSPATMSMIVPPAGSSGRITTRWRYYRLSPNRKVLQWAEFAEKRVDGVAVRTEELKEKVDLSLVSDIQTHSSTNSSRNRVTYQPLVPMTPSSPPAAFGPTGSPSNSYMNLIGGGDPILSFSLMATSHSLAELHCSSQQQYSEWIDGFNMLLDKPLSTKETAELIHALTEIGVKTKLLGISGDRAEVPPDGGVELPGWTDDMAEGFWYDV